MEIVDRRENIIRAREMYWDDLTRCNDCKKMLADIVIRIGSHNTYLCDNCAKKLSMELVDNVVDKTPIL